MNLQNTPEQKHSAVDYRKDRGEWYHAFNPMSLIRLLMTMGSCASQISVQWCQCFYNT